MDIIVHYNIHVIYSIIIYVLQYKENKLANFYLNDTGRQLIQQQNF